MFSAATISRPRTLALALMAPERSASTRRWFQEPSVRPPEACSAAVGRLRTKLIVAEGLPVDDSRPLAPRSTSTRS